MLFKCVDLLKEESGIISIGGCFIGDKPELAQIKLGEYSRVYKYENGKLRCWLDIDLMWPRNVLDESKIDDASVYCDYDPFSQAGLRKIEIEMKGWNTEHLDNYPSETIEDFKTCLNVLLENNNYTLTTPITKSVLPIERMALENKDTEIEFFYSTRNYNKDYFINLILTPRDDKLLSNPYDQTILYNKRIRRLASNSEKTISQLTIQEKDSVSISIARDYIRYVEKEWGEKISIETSVYTSENLVERCHINKEGWTQIYKKAGMNNLEIEMYRKANEPFATGLDDSLDIYRQ